MLIQEVLYSRSLAYRRISLFAEPGMRVGEEFQAAIPELMSESKFIF